MCGRRVAAGGRPPAAVRADLVRRPERGVPSDDGPVWPRARPRKVRLTCARLSSYRMVLYGLAR
eukprot:362675-Chlamydomonas_euryale.AAC.3